MYCSPKSGFRLFYCPVIHVYDGLFSRQAPIGDDNYLHLAGAAGGGDCGPFLWRPWRGEPPPLDLDGAPLPSATSLDITSSTESLRLARHADERSSGKSARSASSGYLAMSCIKHEPADDSDASAERPRRPPKPRAVPAPAPAGEYVDVEPRPPSRRPRPDRLERSPPPARCREYELMADFMSHAPPAVPPRARPLPPPRPPSADDSLLDELQRDACCVLQVCEDELPSPLAPAPAPLPSEPFSRLSVHRKSNPTKPHALPAAARPLKGSSSTSNVHEAGSGTTRPLAERLTPFFLKRRPRAPDAEGSSAPKEDNLLGRLTPRFAQSRLGARGRSLELSSVEAPPKRIERSQTAVTIPARPAHSSIVANLKFLSLHRYGAPGAGAGAGDGVGEEWSTPPAPAHRASAANDIRL